MLHGVSHSHYSPVSWHTCYTGSPTAIILLYRGIHVTWGLPQPLFSSNVAYILHMVSYSHYSPVTWHTYTRGLPQPLFSCNAAYMLHGVSHSLFSCAKPCTWLL